MTIKKDATLKVFFIWCDLITSTDLDDGFQHLMFFCSTAVSWSNPSGELKRKIFRVLFFVTYKLFYILTCFCYIISYFISGQCFQTLRHFTDHSGKWIEFVFKIPPQTFGRMMRLYSGLFFPEIPRDS